MPATWLTQQVMHFPGVSEAVLLPYEPDGAMISKVAVLKYFKLQY
jgi:hypothetical protein